MWYLRNRWQVSARSPEISPRRKTLHYAGVALTCVVVALSAAAIAVWPAGADPSDSNEPPPPLPIITPSPTNWEPKFPFPYDQTKEKVTAADITAEREMCQWYNAQYEELIHQIDRFNISVISNNGNYGVAGVQQHADAVAANIDQSVAFLAPRAQALTQTENYFGDGYFPLYQGESFYLLWQHLSNVSAGIKGRQPAWFTGPSVQRVLRWGSRINRSHVCQ